MSLQNSLNIPLPNTNGQLLIGSTGNPPVSNTLTPGTGIIITNSPGNITINSTSFNWQQVTSNTNMNAFNGYIGVTPGGLTFTLPSTVNLYETFSVISNQTGGFIIAANSNQLIRINGNVGTIFTSPMASSAVTLICVAVGTTAILNVNSTNGGIYTLT